MSKKKNEVLDEFDATPKNKNKAEYNVMIVQKQGGAVKIIKKFPAHRFRADDDVIYLRNDNRKVKFLEIFPENVTDFKNYNEVEVDKLIKTYEEKLRRERQNDSDEINDKDLEFELLKLKAKKRSFKFSHNASYEILDETNTPTFIFLRKGSSMIPYKWDNDDTTIFLPSDNRKKSASIALRNKETKYNSKVIVTGITILLLIVGVALNAAAGFSWYKASEAQKEYMQAYDETEMALAQRRALEVANQCAETSLKVSQSAVNVVNKAEEKINEPKTIIEGILP